MAKRGSFWGTLLAIVAVLGAFGAPRMRQSRAEEAEKTPPAATADRAAASSASASRRSESRDAAARVRLAEHFEELMAKATGCAMAPDAPDAAPALDATADPDRRAMAIARQYRAAGHPLDTLVVSVPDPRQSHLALYYGQMLEALRRAFEGVGYVQDRFWLQELEPQRADAASKGDAKDHGDDAVTGPAPGLMLFREVAKTSDALLVVLFVAESPVFGPDVEQLVEALDFAYDLQSPERRALGVLGPSFSGSAPAFVNAITRFDARSGGSAPAIALVTGSATGSLVDRYFPPKNAMNLSFDRTVVPDCVLEQWLLASLQPDDTGQPIVAKLTELGTGYGAADDGAAEHAAPCGPSGRVPEYQFPLHIAEVRADHERVEGSESNAFPTLRRTLGLKFDPAEDHEYDLPSTHSQLTPYEDELALSQTLGMIRDRGIQFLLIEATDPVDVVFLVEELRKYCPNVTPVLVAPDPMFVHPDLGSSFSGTIVASTYAPSFAIAEAMGDTDEAELAPFPNDFGQGSYNAALTLLDATGIVTGATRHRRGYASGSCHDAACGPQVFVSQIAGSAYWPMASAVYPLAEADSTRRDAAAADAALRSAGASGHKGSKDENRRMPSDRRARVFSWCALFVALWQAAGRLRLLGSWTDALRGSMFVVGGVGSVRMRRSWVAIADVTVAAALLLTSLPFVIELRHVPELTLHGNNRLAAVLLSAIASPALALGLGADAVGLMTRKRPPRCAARSHTPRAHVVSWRRWARRGLLAFWLAPPLLAIGWALSLFVVRQQTVFEQHVISPLVPLHTACAGFPLYRLLAPFTLSSVMPLLFLCAGFYVCAVGSLCRLERLDRFPGSLPHAPADLGRTDPRGVAARQRSTKDAMRASLDACWRGLYDPWRGPHPWVAWALLATFAVWRFLVHFRGTFEGDRYDVTFEIALIALGLVVAGCLTRFLSLGGELLVFLRRLAAEPMVDAYDRIAQKVSGSFGLQLRAHVPSASDLAVSVLSGRRLASFQRGRGNAALRKAVTEVEARFGEMTAGAEAGGRPRAGAGATRERVTHAALFHVAAILREMLDDVWAERASTPSIAQTVADFPREKLLPGGDRADVPTVKLFMGALSPEEYLWVRSTEDFVALRHSTFVYQVMNELRVTLSATLTASFLLVLGISVYPFRPSHFLTTVGWSVVVAAVVAALCRIIALERDEVLSRLGGTTPNKIDWNGNFIRQVVTYGVLPLAAALVGLFPELGDWVVGALVPLTRIVSAGN